MEADIPLSYGRAAVACSGDAVGKRLRGRDDAGSFAPA